MGCHASLVALFPRQERCAFTACCSSMAEVFHGLPPCSGAPANRRESICIRCRRSSGRTTRRGACIIGKHEDIAGHASDTIHLMELEFVEASVTRLYGETAIVVVKAHLKGIFQGSSFAGFYRYLRVWLFQEERWQAVAGNVSVVA